MLRTLLLSSTVLLFVAARCYAQYPVTSSRSEIRPAIKNIVRGIIKANELDAEYVGAAGTITEQWLRYERLKTAATIEELKTLTNSINAVMRCYAFMALQQRDTSGKELFPILLRHLYDTASVQTFSGCNRSRDVAGDIMLLTVTPEYLPETGYKLTTAQQHTIDSIRVAGPGIQSEAKHDRLSTQLKEPAAPEATPTRQVKEKPGEQ